MEFDNRVGGIEPLTLIDYEGECAAILFYKGCNAHCPYCYNPAIVKGISETIKSSEVIDFLKKRNGNLDAIVFSGGECTIWNERIIADMRFAKSLGYLVKVDTNGSNPTLLKYLIENKIVDMVSLDFKAHEGKIDKFFNDKNCYNTFLECLDFLISSNTTFEVRTTVHRDVIDEKDVSIMCGILAEHKYSGVYYIQQFFEGDDIEYLDESLDRHPIKLDTARIDTHGIELSVRNDW